jgi:serine/threonine-protein kinase
MALTAMRELAHSSPVAVGEVLAGKYRVERVLGEGGMGVVVAARHLQLDQLVALKFVIPSAIEEKTATERFLREAKAAVRLKSEHVAKVLDVGTLEDGAPYMVMEYLEGTDLSDVIHREAPMPFDVAADFIIQACEALSEAHSIGIVHRDLKPQNLFVTKGVGGAPLVKVLDFGISKMRQPEGAMNLTQTATVMGSPLYMAPEQMRSARNVDNRTDIWALGVVLHEMLTRKLPFEAETMTELAIKIVQDTIAPVETLRPDVPPELAAVVAKCLEKDVTKRYPDTGELATALEPFASPASRVIVDRARKVISGLQKTMGMAAAAQLAQSQPRADASGPVRAVSSPTHKSPETHEPWSDTSVTNPGSSKPIMTGLVALGVLLLLGFVAYRLTSRPSGDESTHARPADTVVAVPAALPASPPPTPTAAPVPEPPATAPVPVASAAPTAPAVPATAKPPAAPAPPQGKAPPAAAPHPTTAKPASSATGKPNTGDDIPSLR